MRQRLRDPKALVLLAIAIAIAIGFTWGLPGPDTWSADSISPRSCGLGAIAETYTPGHFHTYPPLHMAILTVLSLPWMALAASHVGTSADALAAELIKPLYMTGIEVGARIVAAVMALGIAWNTMRLWTRIRGSGVGLGAGVVVAMNATVVYYAHTGNLDVPYLFWITWSLVEIDRVASGERRERHALVLAALAALTKDQAAAAMLLPLPVYLALVPYAARRASVLRRDLVLGSIVAIVLYALASGALVNPTGFHRRVAFLLGPASQTWATYPRGVRGALALARDSLLAIPHFTSWPIAVAALLGLLFVVVRTRGLERARLLLPFVAAVSFTLFFNFGARRTEDRFLLPQSVFFFPYAAIAFQQAWTTWPARRAWVVVACMLSLAPALLGVASMDATLLADSRYEAERYLAALPQDTRVEVYGGVLFLPRIPSGLAAVRPGVEPLAERQPVSGLTELVDSSLDPRARSPDVIVLATELSDVSMTEDAASHPYALISYRDPVSRRFLRGLYDGSLGYARDLRATCSLPWPLQCRSIHNSTAGEVWIYVAGKRQAHP